MILYFVREVNICFISHMSTLCSSNLFGASYKNENKVYRDVIWRLFWDIKLFGRLIVSWKEGSDQGNLGLETLSYLNEILWSWNGSLYRRKGMATVPFEIPNGIILYRTIVVILYIGTFHSLCFPLLDGQFMKIKRFGSPGFVSREVQPWNFFQGGI